MHVAVRVAERGLVVRDLDRGLVVLVDHGRVGVPHAQLFEQVADGDDVEAGLVASVDLRGRRRHVHDGGLVGLAEDGGAVELDDARAPAAPLGLASEARVGESVQHVRAVGVHAHRPDGAEGLVPDHVDGCVEQPTPQLAVPAPKVAAQQRPREEQLRLGPLCDVANRT